MTRKLLSAFVIAALLVGLMPAPASAAEGNSTDRKAPSVDLRGSIDRSARQLAADAARPGARANTVRHEETGMAQGGGGGHAGMLVMMVVGMAASIGGGYLIYKQMKKTTQAAQTGSK